MAGTEMAAERPFAKIEHMRRLGDRQWHAEAKGHPESLR